MYVVLVPVKPPAVGKSRLGGSLGLGDQERRELAAAFALDTVEACRAAALVSEVLGITDDAGFSAELTAIGCASIPDGTSGDLNGTLRLAAAEAHRRWPDMVPVALLGDLPALRPAELDEVLGALAPGEAAYVADADGSGTTLYTAAYADFAPRFGAGSAVAHGAVARPVDGVLAGLRRDVDDLTDLRQALDLGVGPRTRRRAASLLGDGPSDVS
jgi:2-phospho-L-lactate/phosphoenolpyruvate guanylyltransferase